MEDHKNLLPSVCFYLSLQISFLSSQLFQSVSPSEHSVSTWTSMAEVVRALEVSAHFNSLNYFHGTHTCYMQPKLQPKPTATVAKWCTVAQVSGRVLL